ncbi:MAG: hypothetical protein QOK26_3617 [Pseudonocardiales bacterium]|nr:hypothetical protein [Pseudonocardiales bacterium]
MSGDPCHQHGRHHDVRLHEPNRGSQLRQRRVGADRLNTLGTSTGDFLAHNTGLGFVASTVVITAALVLIVAAHYLTPIAPAMLFWSAYVLTRPFGANAGNTLSKTHDEGGLGLGTLGASGVLAALLVGLVVYQTLTSRRQTRELVPAGDDLAR